MSADITEGAFNGELTWCLLNINITPRLIAAATATTVPITRGKVPRDATRDDDPLVAELVGCRLRGLLVCVY